MRRAIEAALPELVELRRTLHRHPEASGTEGETARRIADHLGRHGPSELLAGLGGPGLAAISEGRGPGPTLLLRADLDAVPVPETGALGLAHRSTRPGLSHKCGHDGHMATLAGVAALLGARPPRRGRVVLLFQPAEETGTGAAAILADPRFGERIRPDRVFAYHNLPGFPRGLVLCRPGTFAWASVGLVAELHGFTAHAGYPEQGRSPALALAELIATLTNLPREGAAALAGEALVTVVHARLGEVAFGTTPGEAALLATLRAGLGDDLQRLKRAAAARIAAVTARAGLDHALRWVEEFPETANDPASVTAVTTACARAGVEAAPLAEPFRWSEDFGHFTGRFPGALFGIGAGEAQPPLHHPDYDFPDELIGVGLRVFAALVEGLLDEELLDEELLDEHATKATPTTEEQRKCSSPR